MTTSAKVFVIIAVHNRIALTRACLDCLLRQTYNPIGIVVVDDGSTDGTEALLPSEFPSVTFVRTDGNRWWTGATNAGLRVVMPQAIAADFVLLMNNDTVVDDDYVSRIVQSSLSSGGSIIGSVAVRYSDRQTIVDGGNRINWCTAKHTQLWSMGSRLDAYSTAEKKKRVNVLPGRGLLIPFSVFERIGLLEEDKLPHYGADYEFTHRAHRRGYGLLVDYDAIVFAHEAETGLANAKRTLSWKDYFRSFVSIRSPSNVITRWHFAQLNCPWYWFPPYFLMDMIRVVIGNGIRQMRRATR